jgi:ABC-type transporter lipoprotein component MlaA
VFRAWELSPGAYNTLPMRDPTTIRTVFMVADDNLANSIRQRLNAINSKALFARTIKTITAALLR